MNFIENLRSKPWFPKVKEHVVSAINTFIAASMLMTIVSVQQINIDNLDIATALSMLGVIIRSAVKYGFGAVLKMLVNRLEKKV